MNNCIVIYGVLLTTLCYQATCEYFTSSSHLKALFQSEKELAIKLKNYIQKEEIRLKKLNQYYKQVQDIDNVKTLRDRVQYVGNPVKSFTLLSRMINKWPIIREWVPYTKNGEFLQSLNEYSGFFPTKEDVSGAQDALLRLQETFALSSNEIVEGLSNNAPSFTKLEVDDAYSIGKKTYYKSQHKQTAAWLSETLRLLDSQRFTDQTKIPSRFEVLDHLAWSEYVNRNIPSAYAYTQELLKLDPKNDRILNNEKVFKLDLEDQNIPLKNVTTLHLQQVHKQRKTYVKKKNRKFKKFYYTPAEDSYERYDEEKATAQALCRGETKPIAKRFTKYLVCFYKTKHPLLILKPAKVERIHVKPDIYLFRDAMSDYEIKRVKELAHPLLQRATVHNPATGKLEYADYRVSKSAWLDEYDDNLVDVMNKRIEAYTGLDMHTAEKLQVANYGIGGHYETHFDFGRAVPLRPPPGSHRLNYTKRYRSNKLSERQEIDGHRIATILFYMTNVERGGSTVFVNIGQAVKPSKGDAVFWYNLHHDGSGDYNTRHAACPVLIGEKWVSNRWIHERGQEFRRKCRLKPEDDYIIDTFS